MPGKFFRQNNHTAYLSVMITKAALLNELVHHSYIMLRPSQVAGIGVFALRAIPKGCRDMFSKPNTDEKWIVLTNNEVHNLPAHARALIENYCLFDGNQYYVPEKGFKALDVSLFLNHSDTPNIISIEDGNYFETLRDISEGEELLIDYATIVDED